MQIPILFYSSQESFKEFENFGTAIYLHTFFFTCIVAISSNLLFPQRLHALRHTYNPSFNESFYTPYVPLDILLHILVVILFSTKVFQKILKSAYFFLLVFG